MSDSLDQTRDPFAPPAGGWRPVSPRLATVRRISSLGPIALLTALGIAAAAVAALPWLVLVAAVIGLVVAAWAWWLIGRQVRATAYALRSDDLVVVSGILFRRLVVVPYGRMQLVDVKRGPIDRRFNLAGVQLHTAAATTDATVPGLPPAAAAELRDQLAALGEQRSAGL
jgi:membrane protein YdbS with pleckstrin-like domain